MAINPENGDKYGEKVAINPENGDKQEEKVAIKNRQNSRK